jgi:Putative MetA-pathway of phenol degradation
MRKASPAARHTTLAFAVAVLVGCASTTASREPIVTDRPDFTESTSTVSPGVVQAEGGYTFSRAAIEKSNTIGELLLRIGLTRNAELRLEPGSYSRVSSPVGTLSGREDGELGAKIRLHAARDHHPSPVPAVALVVATSVPTGSDTFRENRPQPEVKLASEWTLTDRLGLAMNFDVARPVADSRRFTELAASASFGIDLSPRFDAFVELFGFAPEFEGAKHTRYLDTGITASLGPNLQVDLRGGVGLNGTAPDYFVGAGIAHRW